MFPNVCIYTYVLCGILSNYECTVQPLLTEFIAANFRVYMCMHKYICVSSLFFLKEIIAAICYMRAYKSKCIYKYTYIYSTVYNVNMYMY